MKKLLLIITIGLSILSSNGFTAKATDISFDAKKQTMLGTKYRIYNVRCSNGKRTKISSWKKGKSWCVGTSDSKCYPTQMKAANRACR